MDPFSKEDAAKRTKKYVTSHSAVRPQTLQLSEKQLKARIKRRREQGRKQGISAKTLKLFDNMDWKTEKIEFQCFDPRYKKLFQK